MPSNGLVDRRTANNAFGHMLSLSRRGEFPLKETYEKDGGNEII